MVRLFGLSDPPPILFPPPTSSLCVHFCVVSCGMLPTRCLSRWRPGKLFSSRDSTSVVSPSADDEEPCALSESEGDSDKARSNRRRKASCLVGRETFLILTMLVLEKWWNSEFIQGKSRAAFISFVGKVWVSNWCGCLSHQRKLCWNFGRDMWSHKFQEVGKYGPLTVLSDVKAEQASSTGNVNRQCQQAISTSQTSTGKLNMREHARYTCKHCSKHI
jgi:hypothetical protein